MAHTELAVGMLMRCTADPRDIWKVCHVTPKTVVMARCDEKGEFSAYGASPWRFHKTTALRDFHPA